tara:strand:- start:432 stop:650 length:219 start_codon:yes stop_codon:yes gene_type:complete
MKIVMKTFSMFVQVGILIVSILLRFTSHSISMVLDIMDAHLFEVGRMRAIDEEIDESRDNCRNGEMNRGIDK